MRILSTAGATARHGLGAFVEAGLVAAIAVTLVLGVAVVGRSDPAGTADVYAAKGGNGNGQGSGGATGDSGSTTTGAVNATASGDAGSLKFSLSVDHPDGTTLNEDEIVYYAQKLKGGSASGNYAVLHQCFSGGSLVSNVTKGLWFPNAFKGPGTAYFFAFGDTCSGVVIDLAVSSGSTARGAAVVSNMVTYGTNPLP